MTAELHVLCAGYADERVASTVVLIRDRGALLCHHHPDHTLSAAQFERNQ